MSKLLNQINSGEKKVAFQTYTVQHGIESFKIQVPLASVKVFEQQFSALKTTQKTTIVSLVEQVGGKIRTAK